MSQNFNSQHSYDSFGSSHYGDREYDRNRRKRSTSRSRSRSDSRDRKRRGSFNYDRDGNTASGGNQRSYGHQNVGYRDNRNERGGNGGNFGGNRAPVEPSITVVIKGLPVHTTENTLQALLAPFYPRDMRLITQRDGECKGFAFVTFPSLEYSQYFMTTYAGSAGDPNAPQLIIENRSVTIEYAREQSDRRGKDDNMRRDEKHRSGMRGDWLCEACACHNFSRRDTCYRCNLPRSERSVAVASVGEAFGDSLVTSDVPSAFLVVRGFGSFVTEEQIGELFRQFALVKNTVLIRDQQGRVTKSSMAFVEFHTVEHAAYALQCSAELKMDANSLKISFAKEQVMQQIVNQYHIMMASQSAGGPVHKQPSFPPGIGGGAHQPNALVATALQAAQWSMNNGYGGMGANLPTVAATAAVKPKQLWPKHFETNGAAYTFQPKTGYFLDNVTEFFYCPKSKLYYSAKDGVYYQFDATIDPPFKRFDPPLPTEEETKVEEKESTDASVAARAPISLSLGLKTKSSKSGGGLANPTAKKAMVDIAKWGAIQREDDDEAEVDTTVKSKSVSNASQQSIAQAPSSGEEKKSTTTTPTTASMTGSVEHAEQSSILEKSLSDPSNLSSPTTAGGDAQTSSSSASKSASGACVCKLCKRQFNSAEMLARHEKESKLHAENLAKQKAAAAAAPPRQYRDRAEERREKFGSVPDHIPVAAAVVPSSATNIPLPQVEAVTAPVLFDESNPGNLMLRKMGWKEGQGLGKDGDGKEEAVGVELAAGKNTNTAMHSTLKSTIGTSGGGANPSMSYKECVKAATLARFEQLQRSEGKQQ